MRRAINPPMPISIMIAPPNARADQKRPGRLTVCFILPGVHDLKDILREEQHEKPINGKKNTPINSIVCTSLQSHYSTVRPSVDEAKQGKCDFLPFPQNPQRENVSKAAPLVDFFPRGMHPA